MIIIVITISIVYTLILLTLAYTWYKDLQHKEDTDKRILVLEKRLQEYYKNFSNTINNLKDEMTNQYIERSDLEKRIQKLERKNKGDKKNEKDNT